MTESGTRGRYRFVIIVLLLWANFAFGLSFIPIASILPVLEDHYGISHTMAGLLVAMVFIIEAIFGLPGGIVVGWLGQRRSYTLSFFLMGTLTLTALSPSFGALMALRVAYSLGVALFFPATAPLIMRWFESFWCRANIQSLAAGSRISNSPSLSQGYYRLIDGWSNRSSTHILPLGRYHRKIPSDSTLPLASDVAVINKAAERLILFVCGTFHAP